MVITANHVAPLVALVAGILISDDSETVELYRRYLSYLGGFNRAQRHLPFRKLVGVGNALKIVMPGLRFKVLDMAQLRSSLTCRS